MILKNTPKPYSSCLLKKLPKLIIIEVYIISIKVFNNKKSLKYFQYDTK